MQEFKKVTRASNYKKKPLIEEFKKGLNRAISPRGKSKELSLPMR